MNLKKRQRIRRCREFMKDMIQIQIKNKGEDQILIYCFEDKRKNINFFVPNYNKE
jgi:hypothetical protein